MKENELMIGNWVNHTDSYEDGQKKQIQFSESNWYRIGDCIERLEDFEPIPLTEEWLLKFGFEKAVDENIWVNKSSYQSLFYQLTFNSQIGASLYEDSHWIKSNIQYVHQLQNLYFALTNEELKINP
jgi:hypothetical protein